MKQYGREMLTMDFAELPKAVHDLMEQGNFQKAEELLLEAHSRANAERDPRMLRYVLTELVGLCHLSNPPAWDRAEQLSTERERWFPSAYSKLQTANILYYGTKDYPRVIPKLEEAIAQAEIEHDDRTLYTSLSLLGQVSLELGLRERGMAVLSQIEEMVRNKKTFVVGDETCFLEALRVQHLATERVRQLASRLSAVCKAPDFTERLRRLSVDNE